jgi:hypothetical protein
MNRKDELKSIVEKARSELREIEEAESAKVNQALVGKFFKFRNSYSKPNEYWWLYMAVTGLSDEGNPLTWNFSKDIYGKIEVEVDQLRLLVSSGYIEIKAKEFYRAYESLMAELNARNPTKHAPDVAKAAAQKGVLRKNRSGKRAGVA